jgi:hypothetical protein
MSSSESTPGPTPQDDADRVRFTFVVKLYPILIQSAFQIRLKRLAKLQSQLQSPIPSTDSPSASSSSPSPAPAPAPAPKPKPIPRPTPASVLAASVSGASTPKAPRSAAGLVKKKPIVAKFDLPSWEHETLSGVLKLTFDVQWIMLLFRFIANQMFPSSLTTYRQKWLKIVVTTSFGSSIWLKNWKQRIPVSISLAYFLRYSNREIIF